LSMRAPLGRWPCVTVGKAVVSSLSESEGLEMIPVDSIPKPRKRRRKGTVAAAAVGRAALYVRVSTDDQADNGGSLESQEAACRALCDRKDWNVGRVFVDRVSAGNIDRPALNDLRACVKAGEAAAVVVYALDRLSRSQRDTLALLDEFAEAGAGLVCTSQDFDTTTPMGRAMLGMLAAFAELQRAEIRARTKRALAVKIERGEAVGRTPFGLRRVGAGFEADPAEWPIVERILSESAAGHSTTAVADGLNADGVPTPTAIRQQARGLVTGAGVWHAATVAKLRRNHYIRAVAAVAADGERTA
jgi:DNA invertase Pin-like site-specific DNA recombinase